MNEIIQNIKKYADEYHVPIITDEGIEFLKMIIEVKQAKKILEIGTAIGYSAISMASLNKEINVHTVERNNQMYEIALKNVHSTNLENQIQIFHEDALKLDISKLDKDYDLIFIDAAKAQYIKFFEKYTMCLKDSGVIVSDNLAFHGLVNNPDNIESKDVKALVRKIQNYITYLKENSEYKSYFFNIGDGIALTMRSKHENI